MSFDWALIKQGDQCIRSWTEIDVLNYVREIKREFMEKYGQPAHYLKAPLRFCSACSNCGTREFMAEYEYERDMLLGLRILETPAVEDPFKMEVF